MRAASTSENRVLCGSFRLCPMGVCPVYKTSKPEADQLIPTLFSDSTVALGNAIKPPNWLSEKLKHTDIHINFFRRYVQEGSSDWQKST